VITDDDYGNDDDDDDDDDTTHTLEALCILHIPQNTKQRPPK